MCLPCFLALKKEWTDELVPRAEHSSGMLSCLLARTVKEGSLSSVVSLLSFSSQNEKELQELIQKQSEKILGQIDKSSELIVCVL